MKEGLSHRCCTTPGCGREGRFSRVELKKSPKQREAELGAGAASASSYRKLPRNAEDCFQNIGSHESSFGGLEAGRSNGWFRTDLETVLPVTLVSVTRRPCTSARARVAAATATANAAAWTAGSTPARTAAGKRERLADHGLQLVPLRRV
jgi:hypothetical protein